MHSPSPALAATLRALHGETDVHVVAPALDNTWFAHIPALAPGVDPVIGALGALASRLRGLSGLLSPAVRDSPALSTAIASLIGTNAGACILPVWAAVAPAGWGASHAYALIDAVRHGRCEPWVAAALIGPSAGAAALLCKTWEMSCAIRCWGQTTPDDPTAWMDELTQADRDRLVNALRVAPNDDAARCLPWLPEASAADIAHHIKRTHLNSPLDAYAAASPVAHARHAAILSTLMQRAEPDDLDQQIRLAVATGMANAWAAIQRVLHNDPWNAVHVVAAAPWNDLHTDVQAAILSATRRSNICAAIACARGMRDQPPPITKKTARAFFAAVTPEVWTALPAETQQEWRRTLDGTETHLAVRSLGPDPAFLAHSYFSNELVAAVRRHLRDDAAVRQTLLPIAVCGLPLDAVPDVVAALPPPPDPVVFVQIASGSPTMPPALRAWITAHPTAQAAAAAATVLRVAGRSGVDRVDPHCAALAKAFAGWSSEEATALLAALPKDARAALRPNANALANALAHPDRRNAFRQALDTITALSPSVAIPARHALNELAKASKWFFQRQASAALARALRDHGDCFTAIVGALDDSVRSAVLPRLNDPHVGSALDALTAADPFVAHHVAHALRGANPPDEVLTALATAPLDKMLHLWRLLPEPLQHDIIGDRGALIAAAAPERADDLAQAQQVWSTDNLLALRLLINADAERRTRGAAILAQQPDLAVSLLPLLRDDASTALASHPTIAFASADLPPLRGLISARRRRR